MHERHDDASPSFLKGRFYSSFPNANKSHCDNTKCNNQDCNCATSEEQMDFH